MQTLLQDVRLSVRQLKKSPGFAFTAVMTLMLGIGAVTSIFSLVDGVLLKPFAFRDPGRLVVLRETVQEMKALAPALPDNYRHYLRLKRDSKTLEDAAIFEDYGASVATGKDHPNILGALLVSPNFFSVLGVAPILGRSFTVEEANLGHENVVMLSYSAWQKLFDGDRNVLGRTLQIGGKPQTVVGVLPESFRFPVVAMAPNILVGSPGGGPMRPYEIFQPFAPGPNALTRDLYGYEYKVIARLRPGVTIAEARAELEGLQKAHTLAAHLPIHLGIDLRPFNADVTGSVSGALWLLLAAAGAVLLIACVNLANLQLARAVSQERETAVRYALGASRARLIRARLMESLILAVTGGAAGVSLAVLGVPALLAAAPSNMPRIQNVQVNWTVLFFAAAISIATALVFGILPALRAMRVNPHQAMPASNTRATHSREGAATRSLLVAAEIACAVVLLIVTGLALRSFSHLLHQNREFETAHVTVAQVDLFSPQYGDSQKNAKEAKAAFIDRALEALQRLPGVQAAAMTSMMPLTGEGWIEGIARPDHPLPEGQVPQANARWVSPDYFSLLRVPVMEGRTFTAEERDHPIDMVISESTARKVFRGEDAIGKTVHFEDASVTVIGVVADTRVNNLKTIANVVYLPYWERPPWTISFLVRSSEPADGLAPAVRRAIWKIDPLVAIPTLKSLDAQVDDSVATDRFQTILLASFGIAALLLALLGVYGVLAYSVSLREQEFGIRVALGSDKAALFKLVLLQAGYPVLGGLALGMVLSFVATRWVRSLLYEAKTVDPLVIAAGLFLLLGTALLAALLPARRASQVDPMRVLRNE